jgi:hypothetical protein
MKLSSIELALIEELNLEMARACAEVAEDARNPRETRDAAQERGSRLRERARMFHLEARRLAAEPALKAGLYAGPERRRADRRRSERRESAPTPPDHLPAGHERRINPDRRREERRGWPGRA